MSVTELPKAEARAKAAAYVHSAAKILVDGMPTYEITSAAQAVLCLLSNAALKRLGSTALLLGIGEAADAAILARTNVELFVSGAYLWLGAEDRRQQRAESFVTHAEGSHRRQIARFIKYFPRFESLFAADPRTADAVSAGRLDPRRSPPWSGIDLASMVAQIVDPGHRQSAHTIYRAYYDRLSDFVHPTYSGVRQGQNDAPSATSGDLLAISLAAVQSADLLLGFALGHEGIRGNPQLQLISLGFLADMTAGETIANESIVSLLLRMIGPRPPA